MSELGRLDYYLPRTEFIVTAAWHTTLKASPAGSFLKPTWAVTVDQSVAADRSAGRRTLEIEPGWLEAISVTVTLDERGIVTGINSSSKVDYTPIISLLTTGLKLALPLIMGAVKDILTTDSLEDKWGATHTAMADRLSRLCTRADKLLENLVSAKGSDAITAEARALEGIQLQIASIVEARRAWMTTMEEAEEEYVRLNSLGDLVRLRKLMPTLEISEAIIPEAQASLVEKARCMLAVVDTNRPAEPPEGPDETVDSRFISLRRARSVTVGVYLLDEVEGQPRWLLDTKSEKAVDIVDIYSEEQNVHLKNRGVVMDFHPDMSIKTYGISKDSLASGYATAIGGTADAFLSAREKFAKASEKPANQKAEFSIPLEGGGAGDTELVACFHARWASRS